MTPMNDEDWMMSTVNLGPLWMMYALMVSQPLTLLIVRSLK